ncbi:hypothetical protein [Nostoc sp. DedQUE03]|uniref:hypothetical protein n=1 Tax=Nostoc sp. DedQUE03 TaxID=3075389 RepID=UPI00391A532E
MKARSHCASCVSPDLDKAGQVEKIHQLLREESATGNNGWYEAREKLGQTAGYITDISRAWELTQTNCNELTQPQVVGWQCRYALITASVNSLAANIPGKLLVALVKKHLWTPEQGLAYALQKPEPKEKVEALAELVNYLPPNLKKLALSEALEAALAIQDEWSRAQALSALADKLPDVLLPQALEAALAIQSERFRAQALSALASGLSQMPNAKLFPLWQNTLHELSVRTRPNLLQDIKALFPVIFALGGEAATAEVARAIVDVARWWK